MATVPAPIDNPFSGLQGILDKVIGSNTKTKGTTTLDINTLMQQLQSSLGKTATTGQTTANTSNTSKTNADVTDLQKVFGQQQAGISPDALAAIFKEGAKQVPQLTDTYANAVGARPTENSSLATALRDLSTNLTNSAATQSQALLNASGGTAGQIANLTKSTTDTGQNVAQNAQNVSTDNTTNTTGNTGTTNTKNENIDNTTGINVKQSAAAAGLAGLVSLLGGSSGIGGALKSAGGSLAGGLGDLGTWLTGGTPTVGSPNPTIPQDPNADSNPNLNGSVGDPIPPIDPGTIPPGGKDGGLVRGYAAGGQVLDLKDSPQPNIAALLRLAGGTSGVGSAGSIDLNGLLTQMTKGNVPAASGIVSGIDAGLAGGNAAPGTSAAPSAAAPAEGFSTPVSALEGFTPSVSPANAVGIAMNAPVGIASAVASNVAAAISAAMNNSNVSSINSISEANTPGISSVSTMDSSVSPSPDQASVSDAGVSSDAGAASGDSSGAASGDAGPGEADGGSINGEGDPTGTKDKVAIRVSPGEYVMPKDVVDMLGSQFFDVLKNTYHTPVATR